MPMRPTTQALQREILRLDRLFDAQLQLANDQITLDLLEEKRRFEMRKAAALRKLAGRDS